MCGQVRGREGSRRCECAESHVFVKRAKEEVYFCILLPRASSLISATRSPKLGPASTAGDLPGRMTELARCFLNCKDVRQK